MSAESLPDWVRWIATDNDGCVWGFSHEPEFDDGSWYANSGGLPKMTCLGPVVPREVFGAKRFAELGNGDLWRLEDPEAEDDPKIAAWICVAWLAVIVVVIVISGSVPFIRNWLHGLFG